MQLNEKKIKKQDRTIDLGGFKMRDSLNPKIWDKNQKMKSDVKERLSKIADDYFEGLDIPGVDIEDITMTGSLSNYNWSKYSDVDLHIIIDYGDMPMDRDVVQDFLKTKSSAWNKEHDIKVYGFDIEVYVQDMSEEHVSSGVYSVLNDEWVVKPEKKKITINDTSVKNKSNRVMDMIDGLYDLLQDGEDLEKIVELSDKVKDKIKKMRQCGLDKGGEYSVENMVFKVLRRNGMLERLADIKTVAYDRSMTLENINENETEDDGFDWIRDVNVDDIINSVDGKSPQGVVYIYDEHELDLFFDVIEKHNNKKVKFKEVFYTTLLESGVLSVSFFVDAVDNYLDVGYWDYIVRDPEVIEWLGDYGDEFHNKEHYTIYDSIYDMKRVFEIVSSVM